MRTGLKVNQAANWAKTYIRGTPPFKWQAHIKRCVWVSNPSPRFIATTQVNNMERHLPLEAECIITGPTNEKSEALPKRTGVVRNPELIDGRSKWTPQMRMDLLECWDKVNNGEEGLMKRLAEMWSQKYENSGISSQSLLNQARSCVALRDAPIKVVTPTVPERREKSNFLNDVDQEDYIVDSTTDPWLKFTDVDAMNMPVESDAWKQLNTCVRVVFTEIVGSEGCYEARQVNTRTGVPVSDKELSWLNFIVEMILREKEEEANTVELSPWIINCVAYAAGAGWMRWKGLDDKSKKKKLKAQQSEQIGIVRDISSEMKSLRSILSKASFWRWKLSQNTPANSKQLKSRRLLEMLMGKKMSKINLAEFYEAQATRLRKLKRYLKRSRKAFRRRVINQKFLQDEKLVCRQFNEAIQADPTNPQPSPVTKKDEDEEGPSMEDTEAFWRDMYESPRKCNPDADWVKQLEEEFAQKIKVVDDAPVVITIQMIYGAIRHTKNWSATGIDKVANYWLKWLRVLWPRMRRSTEVLFNFPDLLPSWLGVGKTILLFKKEQRKLPKNYRPITCLLTLYKWLTGVLLICLRMHDDKHAIMQGDQRGAKMSSWGCPENLAIDRMVMEDARINNRTIVYGWVDYRKAYDSVPHEWILLVMRIFRFPLVLQRFVQKLISIWATRFCMFSKDGMTLTELIKYLAGYISGRWPVPISVLSLCEPLILETTLA